jgi:prepilin peptidase CpaA
MQPQELTALLDPLKTLFLDGRTIILLLFLLVAAVCDIRTRRIPNVLVASGALFGIIYNTAFPLFPDRTILFPLGGMLLGLALFMPFYVFRTTGAGDVKLFGMVGAFLGPVATFYAALATLVAGGLLSVAYVLMRGTTRRMVRNLVSFAQLGALGVAAGAPHIPRITPEYSAGKLPYAVAVAIGTVGYLLFYPLGVV